MSKTRERLREIVRKGLPQTMTEYRSILEEVYALGFEYYREIRAEMKDDPGKFKPWKME